MKRINQIFTALVVIALLSCNYGFAQDEGHYFTVTTWKLKIPANGSYAELQKIMQEFQDKVVFKNDKVISEKILRHVYGNDMRDVVIISEYANWNDIEAAGEMQNKLSKEAWPDKDERSKFFKTWNKYVVTHSDEIYKEIPEMTKK